jgi:N-acetylmuramoyl-L-alanine amidase
LKNTHKYSLLLGGQAFFVIPVILLMAACSPKGRYYATDQVYKHKADSMAKVVQLQQPAMLKDSSGMEVPSDWVGTVNFGIRKPNYVIIHFTAQDSLGQTLRTFTVTHTGTSAHYVVAKSGKVVHMVNDYLRANHAGVGKWGSVTDMNSISIGIEIDNNGNEPYTDAQVNSLIALLSRLKSAYGIPTANFIGHEDFAPKRKPDPGPYFPWKKMAEKGFGFWSDEVLELAPENFDYVTALRLIGYDVSDLNSAIVAFKRHFVQTDVKGKLTQLDLNILYNVYQKY